MKRLEHIYGETDAEKPFGDRLLEIAERVTNDYYEEVVEDLLYLTDGSFLDGLDETDQKIVKLLIRNARMSYSDIGKQIGLSRVAVKLRVQALEQKGIIEGYTTIIDPQKISGSISCYIELETDRCRRYVRS